MIEVLFFQCKFKKIKKIIILIYIFFHPKWKWDKPLFLVVFYDPPGPYSKFLSEFSDCVSDLLINTDKIIIMAILIFM